MREISRKNSVLKKILVTGHDGFIGSHLVTSLQLKNYQVIGISKKINKDLEITQIKKDIRKITYKDIKTDIFCIVHLAGITDPQYCQENSYECIEINQIGTQKMLEVARKKNCKFVYVSTSHVYGIPRKLPIKENHPINPISIYSFSKLGAEICCESYSKAYNIDVAIIRPFSIYGPKESKHFVIPRIISQLKSKNNITLGNLYPKRDFIFVDDVINAIELVVKKSKGFRIYNVGFGKSYSILEVCNIIKKITGKNNKVKSIKLLSRKNEIDDVVSNSSKIRRLGWKPQVSLLQGLRKTIQAYQQET